MTWMKRMSFVAGSQFCIGERSRLPGRLRNSRLLSAPMRHWMTCSRTSAEARFMKEEVMATFARPAGQPDASAKVSTLVEFFKESSAIATVELTKLFRDPTELLTRAVQPLLWLVVFGQVFRRVRGI